MSTSKLQRRTSQLLSVHCGGLGIRENHRPEWLLQADGNRLELDFYIDELLVAIEVQGSQHYVFSEFFHGDKAGFEKRIEYDKIKRDACNRRGIRLYEVSNEEEAIDCVIEITGLVKKSPSASETTRDAERMVDEWNRRNAAYERSEQKFQRSLNKALARSEKFKKDTTILSTIEKLKKKLQSVDTAKRNSIPKG